MVVVVAVVEEVVIAMTKI